MLNRVRHVHSSCIARNVPIVEVMSSMLTQKAWNGFYAIILQQLSDMQLCSIWGIDWAWCAMYKNCTVWYDQNSFEQFFKHMEK